MAVLWREAGTDALDAVVTQAVSEGMAAGDSLYGIRRRVEGVCPDMTTDQAEAIAHTESVRLYSERSLASWEATGVKRKKWLLSPAPCELCQAIWSKGPIPISQPFLALGETIIGEDGTVFTNDYKDLNAPPAHPSCRCAVAAVFDGDE